MTRHSRAGYQETAQAVRPDQVTVEVVETLAGFRALRGDWDQLEACDPEYTVFLSWRWLDQAFRANPGRWKILTVRRAGNLVGVLPLKYRVHWSTTQSAFQTEIQAAGRLLWSEYTGFLCDPRWETPVLQAMAGKLIDMPWVDLSIRYEVSESRAAQFMAGFPADRFRTRFRDYRINAGQTDNLVCPQVDLPADYEAYLMQNFGKSTRRNFRRYMERPIANGDLRVTLTDARTFDRDIRILLGIWRRRWLDRKGAVLTGEVASSYEKVMRAALNLEMLHLPVLWQGDEAIGALGNVLDPRSGRLHCILSGREQGGSGRNAGFILNAWSIRWAIENGYRFYDFCHGDEAYKFDFGAQARRVNYLSVRRRGVMPGNDQLDPMSLPEAQKRVVRFIETGRTAEALAGSRQILAHLPVEGVRS